MQKLFKKDFTAVSNDICKQINELLGQYQQKNFEAINKTRKNYLARVRALTARVLEINKKNLLTEDFTLKKDLKSNVGIQFLVQAIQEEKQFLG